MCLDERVRNHHAVEQNRELRADVGGVYLVEPIQALRRVGELLGTCRVELELHLVVTGKGAARAIGGAGGRGLNVGTVEFHRSHRDLFVRIRWRALSAGHVPRVGVPEVGAGVAGFGVAIERLVLR